MQASSADRSRGALLGTALGDAVGAPFEGRPTVARRQVVDWLESSAPLTWTDDTAMAMGLARSLVANRGRIDAQHLGDTFAATYRQEPWRGYGSGPPEIFAAAADGTPYVRAAAALFGGNGSFGNGAAMRAAPAGVAGRGDPSLVVRTARDQAEVTHSHPFAQDGAVVIALAVALAVARPEDDPREQLTTIGEHLVTSEMRDALRNALALGDEEDPTSVAERLGNGVAAIEAVPAAVAAFLAAPDDPAVVVTRAVTMGGDTDTIAAMAGAMSGARVGAAALPAALSDRLEARQELCGLADELVAVTG